jgi:hypothetical protein
MDVDRVVRTGLHAGFASDASITGKIDDPIFPLPERRYRTNLNTGRIGAMIAALYGKNSTGARELSFFNVLHPGSIHTDREIVFLFACNRAGMTANALAIVDNEPVVHGKSLYIFRFQITDLEKTTSGSNNPDSRIG